jgi:D-alanyl-D-alanine carboxypeptidase
MVFSVPRFFFGPIFLGSLVLGLMPACSRGRENIGISVRAESWNPQGIVAAESVLPEEPALAENTAAAFNNESFMVILEEAALPPELKRKVMDQAMGGPTFVLDLLTVLQDDPMLRRLVDKSHVLPDGYEPEDLLELKGGVYRVNRAGLTLRRAAAEALEEMAAAALSEGITLVVSSAYRSQAYQGEVYGRTVREMGRIEADRVSARPGYSQHQTGLVVDFGSIDDSFAATAAGVWTAANASRFGWSLSFPQNYEAVTGYTWESWHYRYVGKDLAAFIDAYFGGIQQYALQFIHAWENNSGLLSS